MYSGQGAQQAALNAANNGFGSTILNTPGGAFLNSLGSNVPNGVWRFASGVFARNAKGAVTAFVNNPWSRSIYNTVERRILESRGIPINELDSYLW